MDNALLSHNQTMQLLKEKLLKAQIRMKFYANSHCIERSFKGGEWVYLRLQPYSQTSMTQRQNLKLFLRFYGSFQIEVRIGTVAYHLQLPLQAQVHLVFHVSQLKKKLGNRCIPIPMLPLVTSAGTFLLEPHAILERHICRWGHLPLMEVLVHWEGQQQDAT